MEPGTIDFVKENAFPGPFVGRQQGITIRAFFFINRKTRSPMLFEILQERAAKRISDFQASNQRAVPKYRSNPTNAETRQTPFKTLRALAAF